MNYFELFSIKPNYQVDLQGLAVRYRQLQQQFHPDKFANESNQSQSLAMQQAAKINDAYQVLKHPVERAQYLLSLGGVDLAGEQQTINDPVFLMAQLELREQLEAVEIATDPELALSDLSGRFEQDYQALLCDFEQQFQANSYLAATDTVRKLKFYSRLQQQLQLLEEKILDY